MFLVVFSSWVLAHLVDLRAGSLALVLVLRRVAISECRVPMAVGGAAEGGSVSCWLSLVFQAFFW